MALIYGFSSQNGETSGGLSENITKFMIHIAIPNYEKLGKVEQENLFDNLHYCVRKAAHFTEYAILGILIILFLMTYSFPVRQSIVITCCICLLYAATDEWHQGFINGRSPSLKDVTIDTFGAVAGVVFTRILMRLRLRIKKKLGNGVS